MEDDCEGFLHLLVFDSVPFALRKVWGERKEKGDEKKEEREEGGEEMKGAEERVKKKSRAADQSVN